MAPGLPAVAGRAVSAASPPWTTILRRPWALSQSSPAALAWRCSCPASRTMLAPGWAAGPTTWALARPAPSKISPKVTGPAAKASDFRLAGWPATAGAATASAARVRAKRIILRLHLTGGVEHVVGSAHDLGF